MYPIREGSRVVSTWTALGLFAVAALPWNAAWSQTASPRAAAVPAPRALVDQYCVVCHNQKNATAGVALNGIDFANVGGNAALLEKSAAQGPHGRDASCRHAASGGARGGRVHEIPGRRPSTGSLPPIPIRAGPPSTA